MSSDGDDDYQDYEDFSDNEAFVDDDDDIQIIDDPAPPAPAPPAPTTRRSSHQPPPAAYPGAIPGMGGAGGGVFRNIPQGAFQAGFGGNAFAQPPASMFRRGYRAFSTAILEVQQGRANFGGQGRSNLMYGGKIVMPASALHEITQMEIEMPITFEITNPAMPDLRTHVGVLEFIADEGTVNLPQWIMDQLRLNEGDPIRIVGGRYPKGKLIKIQPQSVDFLEISDPKSVLEQALRNFSVLTAGDIIEIGYQSVQFRLLIMETVPADTAISVIDTDLEVDFAAPLGYIEPDYKAMGKANQVPTMKDKFAINTEGTQDVDARGSGANTPRSASGAGAAGESEAAQKAWEAFKGSGNSLAGKRIKGKGVSVKKIEPIGEGSRIQRTDQPRVITADTQIGGRQVPAALHLPFGHLFFGFDPRPPRTMVGPEGEAQEAAVPFASVGTGNTLSGRAARPPAPSSQPSASEVAQPRATGSGTPFGGQGQSLSGRKAVEVIDIDSD